MISYLKSEAMKSKRTLMIPLLLLGPLGVIGLTYLNYHLRYDYLMETQVHQWEGLIMQTFSLFGLALTSGMIILCSMSAHYEYEGNCEKQLFSLPISKMKFWFAKWMYLAFCLFAAVTLTFILMIGLGIILQFDQPIEWIMVAKATYYYYFAALPILTVQLFLSMVIKNQATPIIVGVVLMIIALFSFNVDEKYAKFVTILYPYFAVTFGDHLSFQVNYSMLGVAVALGMALVFAFIYKKKECK